VFFNKLRFSAGMLTVSK